MNTFENGNWSQGQPTDGELVRVIGASVREFAWYDTAPTSLNKVVVTSHIKRAVVVKGSELVVSVELQDSEGNVLDVNDTFVMPVGRVGAGNYTSLALPFVNGKATMTHTWQDAGEFEVTEEMINMHLDGSDKLDFNGFNISVAE